MDMRRVKHTICMLNDIQNIKTDLTHKRAKGLRKDERRTNYRAAGDADWECFNLSSIAANGVFSS